MRGFEKSQIILSIFREGGDAGLRVRSGIEGAGMVLEILKNERGGWRAWKRLKRRRDMRIMRLF